MRPSRGDSEKSPPDLGKTFELDPSKNYNSDGDTDSDESEEQVSSIQAMERMLPVRLQAHLAMIAWFLKTPR